MADLYFNDVVLLLHGEGSDGSTTFTDSSNSAQTVTAYYNGTAQISTAQAKFGNSSIYLNSGALEIAGDTGLAFGTGDFTAELFIYVTGSGNAYGVGVANWVNNGWVLIPRVPALGNVMRVYRYGAGAGHNGTTAVTLDAWHHIALTRESGTLRGFLDGALQFTQTGVNDDFSYSNSGRIGGASEGVETTAAYFDEVRLTKGVARYTAAFTPPTAAFPDVAGMDHTLSAETLTWTPQALSQMGQLVNEHTLPAETLTWTALAATATPVLPAETLTWTTAAPAGQAGHELPDEALLWTVQAPESWIGHGLPVVALTWATPALLWAIDPPAAVQWIYRAYVTKTGLADLEIPISSFQSRRRDGEPSYLSVVLPNPAPYLSAINDRAGGEIVLYSGFVAGNTETLTELTRVTLDYFRYDLGPRSGSATLSGHAAVGATNTKQRRLTGMSYQAVTNGIRTVRCEPDMYLAPGDTADLGGGETFVVGGISYTVNPTQAIMEVQEVEGD